eukprot:GILJ01014198.1.p1 GENE.GILJ01014198.1~~GILJ01014198.1.p1  ORF type:complete len:1605 (+),score=415.17 GILJ01014198.1:599-4816(+)
MKKGVYVENLIEETVSTAEDTLKILRRGAVNRHVGSTNMNKESSRSHSVFTLVIESKGTKEGLTQIRSARFHLIDLAGSERQKHTDAVGERLKEAGMINRSLSALGNVINALVDIAEGKSRHVHYRDSKLTFLLKDSLGGNSRTCIVANVSPSSTAFGETLSTLKFAQRAKLIRNKAIINEDTSGAVALLKEEIKRLKDRLLHSQAVVSVMETRRQSIMPLRGHMTQERGCVEENGAPADMGICQHERRIEQLEDLLSRALLREKDTDSLRAREVKRLVAKVQSFQELCARLDKSVQANKMVLKLREGAVKRLAGKDSVAPGTVEAELRAEIAVLQQQLEHHPEVIRYAMEVADLKDELEALQDEHNADSTLSIQSDYRKLKEMVLEVGEHLAESANERRSLITKMQLLMDQKKNENRISSPEKRKQEAELQRIREEFEVQIRSLKGDLSTNKQQLHDAMNRVNQLSAEVAAKNAHVDELVVTIESIRLNKQMEVDKLNELHRKTLESIKEDLASTQQGKEETLNNFSEAKLRILSLESEVESMQISLQKFQKQSEELETVVRTVKTDLAKSEQERLRASQREQELDSTVEQLKSELEGTHSELNQLRVENEQARSENELLQNQFEDTKVKLCEEIESKMQSQQELQEYMEKQQELIDKMNQELNEAKNRADKLEFEKTLFQEDHDTLMESYMYEKNQLGEIQQIKSELEAELTRTHKALAVSEEALNRQFVTVASLQSKLAEGSEESKELLHDTLAENATLKDSMEQLKAQVEERAAKISSLQEEAANLRTRVSDHQRAEEISAAKIAELHNSIQQQRLKMHAQEVDYQNAVSEIESIRKDAEETQALSDQDKQQIAELQDVIQQLQQQRDELERAHDLEVESLLNEQAELRARWSQEREALGQQIESEQNRFREQTLLLEQLENDLRMSKEKAVESAQEWDQERAQVQQQHAEVIQQLIQERDQAVAAVQQEMSGLQSSVDELRRNSQQNQSELMFNLNQAQDQLVQRHAADKENWHRSKVELEASIKDLQCSLHESRMELQAEKAAMATRLQEIAQQRSESERQHLQSLKQMEEAKEAALAVAQTKISDLHMSLCESEADTKRIELAAAEDAKVMQQNLESAQARIDELEAEVTALTVETVRLSAELARIAEELEESFKTKQEWIETMNRLREEEDRAYEENQIMKTRMETLVEERSKMDREVAVANLQIEELKKEVDKLTGHKNLNQKIQHHLKIKEENNTLKRDKLILTDDLKRKEDALHKLEGEVTKWRRLAGQEHFKEEDTEEYKLRLKLQAREDENCRLKSDLDKLTAHVINTTGESISTEDNDNVLDCTTEKVTRLWMDYQEKQNLLSQKDRELKTKNAKIDLLEKEMQLLRQQRKTVSATGGSSSTRVSPAKELV